LLIFTIQEGKCTTAQIVPESQSGLLAIVFLTFLTGVAVETSTPYMSRKFDRRHRLNMAVKSVIEAPEFIVAMAKAMTKKKSR
jgi:hypothetical protein